MKDLITLNGAEAARLIKAREISSVELTRACLERIERRNKEVGAWSAVDPELSLAEAAKADNQAPKSPLHGVPFGVKDVIDTRDLPTEFGTDIHRGRRPQADAKCVQLMRDAGAVVLGKCVTTEFAMFTPNETRNPLNLAHTAGGSSSGTGAAVADFMTPLAFGNQTAGSLIRPAAFCGVYGLKPTHGLASGKGILPLQRYFDTLGYMARSLEDIQAFFNIVTESTQTERWPESRRPRIALCKTHQWNFAGSESRIALEQTARQLAEQGVDVEEFELPAEFAGLVKTHRAVLYTGIAKSLAVEYNDHRDQLSDGLCEVIEEGRSTTPKAYARELDTAIRFRESANDLFEGFDAILCPSAPGEAPEGMGTGIPIFQVTWTLLGVPCINLPVAVGPGNLPVGLQLIGRRFDDHNLIALAQHLMQDLVRFRAVEPAEAANAG